MQVVILQHGRYFTTYSNLSGVSVGKGQTVTPGQILGKAMSNDDGIGEVDFIMSNEKSNTHSKSFILFFTKKYRPNLRRSSYGKG